MSKKLKKQNILSGEWFDSIYALHDETAKYLSIFAFILGVLKLISEYFSAGENVTFSTYVIIALGTLFIIASFFLIAYPLAKAAGSLSKHKYFKNHPNLKYTALTLLLVSGYVYLLWVTTLTYKAVLKDDSFWMVTIKTFFQ